MPINKTQAAVVTAATRQTMKLAAELDVNKDKLLDEAELNGLMTAIDTFNNSGNASAAGALPPEKVRMQMAVMQTIARMSDDAKFKDADTIKLSDLRLNMKKTFNDVLTTATKTNDGGLMNGLGGLLALVMLPDVAVKHVQETLRARGDG